MEQFILMLEPDRKQAGYMIYRFHVTFIIALLLLVLCIPKSRPFIILAFIPFFYVHMRNGGCPITHIERKLHREDITMLDPVLALLNIEITNKNRNTLQVIVSTLFVLLLIYLILFP